MIEKTMKWPLMTVPTMHRWVSTSGKLLVLGDAAHAMVPYMSQGESPRHYSAHVQLTPPPQVPQWQSKTAQLSPKQSHMREAPRTCPTSSACLSPSVPSGPGKCSKPVLINGKIWHFADGPEQVARDLAMQPEVLGLPFDESPNQWSDPETQKWAYGYDAVKAIASALGAQNGVNASPPKL